EVIIEPKFYGASSFSKDGLAVVKGKNGKYGYIDINGDIVISEIYDTAFDFNDGVAPVYVNGRSFFIDTKGTEVIDIDGYIFSEGFTVVRNDDRKYAYFDKSGKALTDYSFDFANEFENGYASVEIDGLYGCIDHSGNFVIEPSFKFLGGFSDNGLASAKDENDLFGFVNNKGEWVIEPKYKTIYDYFNGVNLVEIP
uniref:WG repeat-containing protein n=1 Tax=Butyrivibrio proteoclasticus TaxID=43305 RepID=UPI000479C156